MRKEEQYAAELTREATRIVEGTLAALYRRHPAMKLKYSAIGKQRCREDIAYHLCTLTEAIIAGDADIFLKYAAWGKYSWRAVTCAPATCTSALC